MSYFEFPQTREYNGDLGYILKKLEELTTAYNTFFDYNSIRFHDPINWDIETSYPAFNIVYDTQSAYLMISKQPVPSGISISNSDYWYRVSPFSIDMYLDINSINPVSNKTITEKLSDINIDITALNEALQTEINNRSNADDTINNRINTTNNTVSELNNELEGEIINRTNADDIINARIDQFVALPEGSTTGDAELMDIRVGANGITYDTAGDAVRGQCGDNATALKTFVESGLIYFDVNDFEIGGINTDTGAVDTSQTKRITQTDIAIAEQTITIKAKTGFKFRIANYSSGSFVDIDSWKTGSNTVTLDKGSEFRIMIAEYPTEQTVTDISDLVYGVVITTTYGLLIDCIATENTAWED